MTGTVEFFGETYALSGEVSEFGLLEFAEAAADGQDGDTMQGMASIMRLLRECVAEKDAVETYVDDMGETQTKVVAYGWGHFKAAARSNRATVQDHLMPVIQKAFEAQADRPTGRPSDSSDGPRSIEPKSESSADVKVSPFRGRPDLDRQLEIARAG